MNTEITLQGVSKKFRDTSRTSSNVLENIELHIKQSEFFVFVGPSGCGKSTLLRIMSGLEEDHSGTVSYAPGITQTDMSFVFQQFALMPWLTVYENVRLSLIGHNIPESKHKEIIKHELLRFGLEKFAHNYPHELSGGMRQRAGMARAHATSPKIIFMDEPFSELDTYTARELRKELLTIWAETKITIVLVTHLVEEALELADRIAIMTPRPGKIEKIITNTLPRPRKLRAQEFFDLEDEIIKIIHP